MRIFDRPAVKIEVELSELGQFKDGANMECRATVFMPHGKAINITEVDDDMYKAIDLCHHRLVNQVKRERDRRRNTTKTRKEAERSRAQTARQSLTPETEKWETEVEMYENSTALV